MKIFQNLSKPTSCGVDPSFIVKWLVCDMLSSAVLRLYNRVLRRISGPKRVRQREEVFRKGEIA
jgi:hypothetical protein